jgi:hypothetical protein
MALPNLRKADITVGDIYHLQQLPGHKLKPRKRSGDSILYDFDDDMDEDDSCYYLDAHSESDGTPTASRRPSDKVLARYTAEGLDWRITDHPVAVTCLMEGKDGYESKVLVCQVSRLKPIHYTTTPKTYLNFR